jgi:hypothetical protein
MNNNIKRGVWVAAALLGCFGLAVSVGSRDLFAGELVNKSAAPDISNIGFMENPPKELKEKFPMCDAFLKVEWIDKENKIGYSNYEAIVKNKKNQFKGEKKTVWALVNLNGAPGIDYDVYEYKRQGRLNEIFDRVRNGKVKIGIPMMIEYKGEIISLYGGKALNDDSIYPLLSDYRQTVCVTYPDEQRAWVIEGKNVKQNYSDAQRENLYSRVRENGGRFSKDRFEKHWMLDINSDGVEDFVFDRSYIYSLAGKYFQADDKAGANGFTVIFPPDNMTCLVDYATRYITTDGNKYYINNQCNLTELTSQTVKE